MLKEVTVCQVRQNSFFTWSITVLIKAFTDGVNIWLVPWKHHNTMPPLLNIVNKSNIFLWQTTLYWQLCFDCSVMQPHRCYLSRHQTDRFNFKINNFRKVMCNKLQWSTIFYFHLMTSLFKQNTFITCSES